MDVAVQGVEGVVSEVVEGLRMVVRLIAIGIMFLAAAVIVWIGFWMMGTLRERSRRLAFCSDRKEEFCKKYGGRLLGGAGS